MGFSAGAIASWAGGLSASTVAAGAAVVGTGIAAYSANEAGKNAKRQLAQQAAANVPPPKTQSALNPNATREANAASALAGIPGTLLTGTKGIDPNSLTTGKTLLGG